LAITWSKFGVRENLKLQNYSNNYELSENAIKMMFFLKSPCAKRLRVEEVLIPTSQESQDKVTSIWSICWILKDPNFKDHSCVFSSGKARHPRNESALLQFN
jgi:hypothetical protein